MAEAAVEAASPMIAIPVAIPMTAPMVAAPRMAAEVTESKPEHGRCYVWIRVVIVWGRIIIIRSRIGIIRRGCVSRRAWRNDYRRWWYGDSEAETESDASL